jgi:transcriptional regulator with XRE-family HTH domain
MNLSFRLVIFREYCGWELEDVARKLEITFDEYKKIENGKSKINGAIAQRLSDLYQAPIEIFIIDDTPYYLQAEVMYSNCSFSGGGTNGYINHNYDYRNMEEILLSIKEETKSLRFQIDELSRQNGKLAELLGERIKQL